MKEKNIRNKKNKYSVEWCIKNAISSVKKEINRKSIASFSFLGTKKFWKNSRKTNSDFEEDGLVSRDELQGWVEDLRDVSFYAFWVLNQAFKQLNKKIRNLFLKTTLRKYGYNSK